MKITKERLAAIAEDTAYIRSHQNEGSSLVEPEVGARAARRFLAAVATGEVAATDAWLLVCQHMHNWAPHEDPRLAGFINQLATSAAAAKKFTVAEAA